MNFNALTNFHSPSLKPNYWMVKCISDALVSAVGILAIGFSGFSAQGLDRCLANGTIENCENLTYFNYTCLFLSIVFLTFPLVRNTELAWAIRETVVSTASRAVYVEGTMSLPTTIFAEMWLNNAVPSYFWRVVVAVINGPRFVCLLPVEMVFSGSLPFAICVGGTDENKRKHELQWNQWLSFSPSIVLVLVQYALLYVLLQQAESVLDTLFATVSLQVFAELSQQFVAVAFNRQQSAGELVSHYTQPLDGIPKVVHRVIERLSLFGEVRAEFNLPMFQHFLVAQTIPDLLVILKESVQLLSIRSRKKVTIGFTRTVGGAAMLDSTATIEALVALVNVMKRFDNAKLLLGSGDYDHFTDIEWLQNEADDLDLGGIKLVCVDEQNAENHGRETWGLVQAAIWPDDGERDLEEGL